MTTEYPILYAIMNAITNILGALLAIAVLLAPIAIPAWFITSITKFTHSEKGTKQRSIWLGNLIASSIVLAVAVVFAVFIVIIIYLAQDAVIYM